jgi:hypothetical protein
MVVHRFQPASLRSAIFEKEQGKELAPSRVSRRLYAIREVHVLLRLPDPTRDGDINLTYRRIHRRKAVRPKQAKALTRDYLDRFLASEPDTA